MQSSKQLSVSTDCIFAADFDAASDFTSSATGRKALEHADIKSQDESKLRMSAETQAGAIVKFCTVVAWCIY